MQLIIILFLCLSFYQSSEASVADTGLVAYPSSFEFTGFIGTVFNDSITIVNNTGSSVTVSIAESSTISFAEKHQQAIQSLRGGSNSFSYDISRLIGKLKPQVNGFAPREFTVPASVAGVNAYTTIIDDERGDTTPGSLDVYRIEHQKRVVPVFGTYFDFRIVTKILPDSNVVGILSVDADQEFGTGLFPTPGGIGLPSRDIGSEFEILLDASGIIAETLGLGNIPIGIIYKTIDTSIAGIPLPLSITHDSVFTITFANVMASWLNDADLNMNIGGVFLRLGSGLNPYPDFAPPVSHGVIGTEKPVSWIREDTTSFTIEQAESLVVHVQALAANPAGTYTMGIQVKAAGETVQNIPVTLTTTTLPDASISISPGFITDTMDIGETTTHSITIYSLGEGSLGYAILDMGLTTWLTVLPPLGTVAAYDSADILVRLSTNGLSANTLYTTVLRIFCNDPNSGIIDVSVSLYTTGTNEATVEIESGWNLLSLPLELTTTSLDEIFPTAISHAFQFGNGYLQTDSLEPYQGFWLRFSSSQTVTIEGELLTSDTIGVKSGWNLIGTISDTVSVASIQTEPPDILISDFFSFTIASGYQQATELVPSKGYWVRSSSSGKIIFPVVKNESDIHGLR